MALKKSDIFSKTLVQDLNKLYDTRMLFSKLYMPPWLSMAALIFTFVLTSCSKLVTTSVSSAEKYTFPGISSLGVQASGVVRLAWPALPDSGAVYSVYSRKKTSELAYSLSGDPLIKTSETLAETKPLPLNETYCFMVRAVGDNYKDDANTKEVCTTDDGVSDFAGIATATSIVSGQVNITWVKSVDPNVTGYNIYQANNFLLRIGATDASANSYTISGLPPGERREFGVRAFDKNGREDNNKNTVIVLISDAVVALGDFPGCVSATGLDVSSIEVKVAFPEGASGMKVYRDGMLLSLMNQGTTTLIDDRLSEGSSYTYRCEAMINGIATQGTAQLTGTTQNINPPNFTGLDTAVVSTTVAGQVALNWSTPGVGPKVSEYKIYRSVGTSAPAITPSNLIASVSSDTLSRTVTGLGDELKYTFAVVACSLGQVCTGGTKSVTTANVPDSGYPTTVGATSARMVNGKAVLTVPWTHNQGAIARRKIYLRNPLGSVSIGGYAYELLRSETVVDIYNPPLELEVGSLVANTTYFFVVRDEDTLTPPNISLNTSAVSVNSGDIAAPNFSGIVSLNAGTNVETQLSAVFTAVAPEGTGAGQDPAGVSQYLVYRTEALPPASPANPCSSSTISQQIDAQLYTAGQTVTINLTGLTPRRNYSVCIKGRDTAGNISNTVTYLTRNTLDSTAPLFDGINTMVFNNSSEQLELRWVGATSSLSDVRNYRITLYRCAAGTMPDCTASSDTVQLTSTSNTGVDLAKSTFNPALQSNDKVSVKVNACDDASPTYGQADNCTASSRVQSATLPDIDPPAGFSGITAATPETGVEGAVRVSWTAPSNWTDYRGFKVYLAQSNETLTLIKDCACAANGCSENPTSCLISSLDAKRTYNFFVRAYDQTGNHTALPTSPYGLSRPATTLDLTAPTFNPGLSATFVATGARGVNLTWGAASDNQSSSEAGALITYRVYRKVGSTFAGFTASAAPGDGTLLLNTTSLSYLYEVTNLTANTTDYYAVCALDTSSNIRCVPSEVRSVLIPRLNPPIFPGLSSVTVGDGSGLNKETTVTLNFLAIASETLDPSNGATSYSIYTTETFLPAEPENACTATSPAPILRGSILGTSYTANQAIAYNLSGLAARKKYSICLRARDSAGNESATTTALTAQMGDSTVPVFTGLQNVTYNGGTNTVDLTWTPPTGSDLRNYKIKIWKSPSGLPSDIVKTAAEGSTGTVAITKTDFDFLSNDQLNIVVNACDDASPTYASADNCTTFADSTARQITLPDVTPPDGFAGATSVTDFATRATGTARVNWAAPSSGWADYRGFKIYDVLGTTTLLKDCPCLDYGCSNQILSCDIGSLDAGRTYRFYVRGYDNAGNESALANPNPISNFRSFRTADLVAPNFTGSLQASYQSTGSPGISLSWSAATDNQYAAEPNTIGYRLYRKAGSTFTSLTRSVIEAEGTPRTLSSDTARTFLDATSGLTDGTTYYYTACAFDREPGVAGGNTTCDGAVRSVTVPDITAPTLSGLTGSPSILTRASPSFNLSWMMSDNVTSSSQLVVTVRRNLLGTTATDFPSPTDAIYLTSAGLTSLAAETGVDNVDAFITYRITVADAAGNELNTSTFAIQSKRASLPTVLGSPSVSLVGSSTSVLFTLTYSGAASLDSNGTIANKVTVNTVSGTFSCTKAVSGTGLVARTVTLSNCTGNGTLTISVAAGTALDSAGNASSSAGPSALVTVDNLPPVLTTTTPASNSEINSTFTMTGTCETGLSVVISGAGISGSPQSSTCSGGLFSKDLSLIGSEGSKSITVSEDDGVNSSSLTLNLIKDSVAPSLSISLPVVSAVINNATSNLPLSGTCETGYNVVIEGDVPAGQSMMCTAGAFSFEVWQLNSGEGAKSVSIRQTDLAGNTATASRSYTLNTSPVPVGSTPQLDTSNVIKALHVTLNGTCDSDPAFVTSAVTTLGRVQSVSCVSNILTVNVTDLPDGRNPFTVTVATARIINGLNRVSSRSFTYQFFCPKGYVGIPGKFSTDADFVGLGNPSASSGNADGGLDPGRDFCVMKYIAKAATSNASSQAPFEPVYDGNKSFNPLSNYWPESRADSTPWTNISRDNAALRCRALNETLGACTGTGCNTWSNDSYGYGLMSNTQWQVAARNLENTGANWTSGTVGSGYLWRGHTDDSTGPNAILHTLRFGTWKFLSNPRSDAGNSDYFGTGNSVTENNSGTSGWQERRRFVISNGRSIWDFGGNVWQWVSDNYSTLNVSPAISGAWGEFSNTTNFPVSGVNRLNFAPSGSYDSSHNTGRFYGGWSGAVARGSDVAGSSDNGIFAGYLSHSPTVASNGFGFRCTFLPSLPAGNDTSSPIVTLQRVDSAGSGTANSPVTVAAGGVWNMGISVFDAENTGSDVNKIFVQVRRKVSASSSDFPVSTDAVYQSGYNLTSLPNETAWVQNPTTGQYTRNDNMFVNYLVRAKDPAGNVGESTFSVSNTKSCPPGYVGVPGSATTGLGSPLATLGNSSKSLDPSFDFCVMKYPAKVMSAGTTGTSSAQTVVGGLFEPIMNGNNTFTNDYTYTNATTFNNRIIYLPESRSSGTPWVNINRDDSISACRAQQMQYFGSMPDTTNGGGFQLISNTQWQVVARNAEAVGSNWSGNGVGTGVLNRGHSDNAISATEALNSWCFGCTAPSTSLSAAPNSVTDSNGYFATGAGTTYAAWNTLGISPAAGSEQKRTFTLSNGRIVWDFAGNTQHWVSDNYATLSMSPVFTEEGKSFSNTGDFPVSGVNRLNFAPSGPYSSSQNAGSLWGGSAGTFVRSSGWFDQSGGLFAAALDLAPTDMYNGLNLGIGFRCVYNPPPNSGTISGMAPEITALGRVTDLDDFMENSPVTISNGGSWNLKWAVSDAETSTSSLVVEVRRKIANTATDFPISSDSLYLSGTGATLTKITQETAWASTVVTNNSKFVNYLITVQDAHGNSTSRTFSVTNTSSCPSGYLGVPGNSTVGLGSPLATIGNATKSLDPSLAFCVMKYHAKNVSSVAVSVPSGTPWVNISRDTAATRCSSLGSGFGLLSNTQWQVMARNAESVASNWSGGAVGSGVLNRGHSDTSPAAALASSADDTAGYFGTENTGFTSAAWKGLGATPATGAEQKRTYDLSNGKVVWDIGGNATHWVSDNYSTLNMSPALSAAFGEFSNTTNFPGSGVNRLNFAPSGSYNSAQNAGLFYGGSGGGIMRGSHYNATVESGLFHGYLGAGPEETHFLIGFRCAFVP